MSDAGTNPYASPRLPLEAEIVTPEDNLDWPALRRVRRGLTIYFYGIWFYLFVIVLAIGIGAALAVSAAINKQRSVAPNVANGAGQNYALGGGSLVGSVTLAVGLCLCVAVPKESAARGLAIMAAALELFSIIIVLPNWWLKLSALELAGMIAPPVSWLCLLLFLRRLAIYIDQPRLRSRATALAAFGGTAIVAWAAMFSCTRLVTGTGAMPRFQPEGPQAMGLMLVGLLGIVDFFGSMVIFVFFMILMYGVRGAAEVRIQCGAAGHLTGAVI